MPTPLRTLALLALFTVGAGSGCICVTAGPDPDPDARFDLTFQGTQDCLTARVGTVRVSFEGSAIGPVTVTCPQNGGGLDIIVRDVPAGEYTVLLQAFDIDTPTFVAYSSKLLIDHVDGVSRRTYPVTLTGTTLVTTYFTFAANTQGQNGMTCAQAGVANMHLVFTRSGGAAKVFDVPCHDAATSTDGASLTELDAGTYAVDAQGLDSGGTARYQSLFQGVQVVAAGANDIVLNVLASAPAHLVEFTFRLPNDSTCAAMAVSYVNFTLENAAGQQVSAQPYTSTCDQVTGRPSKVRFEGASALPAGTYVVDAAAYSASNQLRAQALGQPVSAPAGQDIGWTITLTNP